MKKERSNVVKGLCEEDSFILSKEGSEGENERQAKIDRICLLNRNIFSQVQNL